MLVSPKCCLVSIVGLLCNFLGFADAAALKSSQTPTRLTRRLPQADDYTSEYARTTFHQSNAITYETQPLQSVESFQTQPHLTTLAPHYKAPKQAQQFNSYTPPPSGNAAYHYSHPLATHQPAARHSAPSTALFMVEEPSTATFLSQQQNETLRAAQKLAATLLHATGDSSQELEQQRNTQVTTDATKLNTTDLVILKSQKNAYIIPTPLSDVVRMSHDAALTQQLYRMRENLQKAFTVNQFIFIIKPEKINFLNKLV